MIAQAIDAMGKFNRDQRFGFQARVLSLPWERFLHQDFNGFMRSLSVAPSSIACSTESRPPMFAACKASVLAIVDARNRSQLSWYCEVKRSTCPGESGLPSAIARATGISNR